MFIPASNQEADLRLLQEARAGNTYAHEALIEKYLPMVKHIVRKHIVDLLEFDDLVQEGLIGLLGAIGEYNPERFDVKFSSFAYLCIQRKIFNAIKSSMGNKHRALNHALSIHAYTNCEETRTFGELIADERVDSDPFFVIEDRLAQEQLTRSLQEHLSRMEFLVTLLLTEGFTLREMERHFGLAPKQVDNARTRVKMKIRRLIEQYGSLEPLYSTAGRPAASCLQVGS